MNLESNTQWHAGTRLRHSVCTKYRRKQLVMIVLLVSFLPLWIIRTALILTVKHVCCLQEPGEEKLTRQELCFIRRFTHLRAQNRCCRQMLAADAVHSGISKGLVWMTLNATLTELNCSKHPEKWRETNSSLQQMRLRSARAETSDQLQQRTSAGSAGPAGSAGCLGVVGLELSQFCTQYANLSKSRRYVKYMQTS